MRRHRHHQHYHRMHRHHPQPPAHASELARSDRAMEFTNYLMTKHGYSIYAASAAIGHSIQESKLNPGIAARDGSGSRALMQWLGPRKRKLYAYAKQQHADWRNPFVQLDFFARENNTTEKSAGDRLKAARSYEEASKAMMDNLRPRGYRRRNPTRGHAWRKRLANTIAVGNEYLRRIGQVQDFVMRGRRPAATQTAHAQPHSTPHRYRVASRHVGRVASRYRQGPPVYYQVAQAPEPRGTRYSPML